MTTAIMLKICFLTETETYQPTTQTHSRSTVNGCAQETVPTSDVAKGTASYNFLKLYIILFPHPASKKVLSFSSHAIMCFKNRQNRYCGDCPSLSKDEI